MPDATDQPTTSADETSKPWYRSTTLQGLLVMLAMLGLQKAHLNVPGLDQDVNEIVSDALQLVGIVMVAVGRFKARKTLTATATAPAGN